MLVLTMPINAHDTDQTKCKGVSITLPDGRTGKLWLRRKRDGGTNQVQMFISAPRDLEFVRDTARNKERDTDAN